MHQRYNLSLVSVFLCFISAAFFYLGMVVTHHDLTPPKPVAPVIGDDDDPEAALEFRYRMIAGEGNTLDPLARMRAITHTRENNSSKALEKTVGAPSWVNLGPGNIGGRIRSIIIKPSNTSVLLVGAVAGGVWKSTNGGTSWIPKLDNGVQLAIGCMVADPVNENIIYAGTGEGWGNSDAVYGGGIYKSTDFGDTWNLLPATIADAWTFRNVLRLAVDANGVIYAATKATNRKDGIGSYYTTGGIFKSTDGGSSWKKINSATASDNFFNPKDIIVLNPTTLLCATGPDATVLGGIFKSTNGGTAWTKITAGLPTADYDRIAFAKDPANANNIFAVFGSKVMTSPILGLENIYKSTDAGSTWSALPKPPTLQSTGDKSYLNAQEWYDNVIAVNPFNSNVVFAGGVELIKSTDGGTSWQQTSYWHPYYGSPFSHADHHALVFDPVTPDVLYDGNDGGLFKTTDAGASWTSLNNGLEITQFYGGAVAASGTIFQGGTQDNGHLQYTGSGTVWDQVYGGDGGYAAIDQSNANVAYEEYVYLDISKSTDGGVNWNSCTNGLTDAGSSSLCLFIAPFALNKDASNVMIAGSDKVWLTTDAANNWNAMSNTLVPSAKVSAVTVANATATYLAFAGTTTGKVFKCSDLNSTLGQSNVWTDITPPSNNGAYVRRIVLDPNDKKKIYVCYSGYNNNSTAKHVWYSADQGSSWIDISGNLPDVPVHTLVVDTNTPTTLYIGTETGVYQTTDRGTSWVNTTSGMPTFIPVEELVLQKSTNRLFAFTHGRSAFMTTTPLLIRNNESELKEGMTMLLKQNYPNPFNPSTKISFVLRQRENVSLKVYDAKGRELATLLQTAMEAGEHTVDFNPEKLQANTLPSGVYLYALQAGVTREVKKMVYIK